MTSPTPAGSQSPAQPHSKGISLDVYVLHCGQGDTILVRLPDDRWVLVDCYLPKQPGIHEKFFAFLAAQQVKHLAMIVQTHPDFDHYHGMLDVVKHFTSGDRRLGSYFDSGVGPQEVRALLNADYATNEFANLQELVEELAGQGKLVWLDLDAQRPPPLSPAEFAGAIEFIPIGPDRAARRTIVREALQKLAKDPDAKVEANGLSIVLGIAIQDQGQDCYILLAADAERDGIEGALAAWADIAKEKKRPNVFDVVKVAHHASIKNHFPALCKVKRSGNERRIAAVSAGERKVLPDKQVLQDFLAEDWCVVVTTTRKKRSVTSNRPMQLAGRGSSTSTRFDTQDIHIRWDARGGLTFEPLQARLNAKDLGNYETAGI
jgi:beta-lactamase superfamily II metal-dependent hydrolase